jgi:uncharacterized SAM-binding protein YcdF (DUF218 family)
VYLTLSILNGFCLHLSMRPLIAIIALSLLSFTGCMRHMTKHTYNRYIQRAPYDAVVVPGIQYDTANLSMFYKSRILWAKMLYDKGITKNIIFSGGAVYTPYKEGMVMKIIADSLGIPPEHTFAETKAKHSNENVYYGWQMAREMGFTNIALATDPVQSWLFGLFAFTYKDGLPRLPVLKESLRASKMKLPAVDLRDAYVKDFVPHNRKGGLIRRIRESFICVEEKNRKGK